MSLNKTIVLIGIVCASLYGGVTWLSFGWPESFVNALNTMSFGVFEGFIFELSNGFYYDNSGHSMPTGAYLGMFFMIFALVFYAFRKVESFSFQEKTLKSIIFFSILFRLLSFWGEPIHENDIYRYLWDAKVSLSGVNPYKYAPSDILIENQDIVLDKEVFNEIKVLRELKDKNNEFFDRIGYRDVPTIYPPFIQVMFMIPVSMFPDSLILMRMFFVIFDLGALLLIILILKHFQMNPCLSILYGWMPLVVIQLSSSGHYDSIVIFFIVFSIYLYLKDKMILSCFILALATLLKLFPIFIFPILFRKNCFKYCVVFMGTVVLFYVPYMLWGKVGMAGVFEGTVIYNREWSYHSSIFSVIYEIFKIGFSNSRQAFFLSKVLSMGIYCIFLIKWVCDNKREQIDILHKVFLSIAFLFLINPVGNAWYYCWVVPFLCFFSYRSWIYLSGLLMLSYYNFQTDIPFLGIRFFNIKIMVWITYVPFFGCLIYEMIRRKNYKQRILSNNEEMKC